MWETLNKRLDDLLEHTETNGTRVFDEHSPIRFENVQFVFPNGKMVFDHLNLVIEPKKTTAIIGSSGIGKSTLLDLTLGLNQPTQGTIFYGSIAHGELDKSSLRKKAAYVTQEVTLVDGSLRENLAIRLEECDDQKIQTVLKKVGLNEVIAQMPQGIETPIGENGVKLSGGQRQRIAIGRALFMDPQILILDEATSNLDTESEFAILETIKKLKEEFTILIVTHRISSVRFADNIFLIENGSAVEKTYDELAGDQGRVTTLN
jgi:ABC-type multidrug transport system fused ATPase/permease subunit